MDVDITAFSVKSTIFRHNQQTWEVTKQASLDVFKKWGMWRKLSVCDYSYMVNQLIIIFTYTFSFNDHSNPHKMGVIMPKMYMRTLRPRKDK